IAVPASLSMAMIATLAGCDPAAVHQMEIDPSGADIVLDGGEVPNPTTFLNALPAVVYDNGSGTVVSRLRLSSAADLNGNDTVAPGATLHIAITSDPCMSVTASVAHTRTTVGKKLAFTVAVKNAKPGESFTARWDFRDGTHVTVPLQR